MNKIDICNSLNELIGEVIPTIYYKPLKNWIDTDDNISLSFGIKDVVSNFSEVEKRLNLFYSYEVESFKNMLDQAIGLNQGKLFYKNVLWETIESIDSINYEPKIEVFIMKKRNTVSPFFLKPLALKSICSSSLNIGHGLSKEITLDELVNKFKLLTDVKVNFYPLEGTIEKIVKLNTMKETLFGIHLRYAHFVPTFNLIETINLYENNIGSLQDSSIALNQTNESICDCGALKCNPNANEFDHSRWCKFHKLFNKG